MARKYQQGIYRPLHPEKYVGDVTNITFRSSWERRFLRWCDLNPSVIKFNSEEIIIPYYSQAEGKNRRYFVDFIVQFKTAEGYPKTVLIEIKPDVQTRPPSKHGNKKPERYLAEMTTWQVNQDKWAAATAWAEKHGMRFCVLNEYDLGIAKKK